MADVFDAMMNKTCTVLQLDPNGTPDDSGQPSKTLVNVASNVPCRISTLSKGKEFKTQKQVSIGQYVVFMRVIAMSEHYVLRIDGVDYNILEVNNPSGADHHLELTVEKLKP